MKRHLTSAMRASIDAAGGTVVEPKQPEPVDLVRLAEAMKPEPPVVTVEVPPDTSVSEALRELTVSVMAQSPPQVTVEAPPPPRPAAPVEWEFVVTGRDRQGLISSFTGRPKSMKA